mgnify:FL=1
MKKYQIFSVIVGVKEWVDGDSFADKIEATLKDLYGVQSVKVIKTREYEDTLQCPRVLTID